MASGRGGWSPARRARHEKKQQERVAREAAVRKIIQEHRAKVLAHPIYGLGPAEQAGALRRAQTQQRAAPPKEAAALADRSSASGHTAPPKRAHSKQSPAAKRRLDLEPRRTLDQARREQPPPGAVAEEQHQASAPATQAASAPSTAAPAAVDTDQTTAGAEQSAPTTASAPAPQAAAAAAAVQQPAEPRDDSQGGSSSSSDSEDGEDEEAPPAVAAATEQPHAPDATLVLGMAFANEEYAAASRAAANTSVAAVRDRRRLLKLVEQTGQRLVTINDAHQAEDCAPQLHLHGSLGHRLVDEVKALLAANFSSPRAAAIYTDYIRFPGSYLHKAYSPFLGSMLAELISQGVLGEGTTLILPHHADLQLETLWSKTYPSPQGQRKLEPTPLEAADYPLFAATEALGEEQYDNGGAIAELDAAHPFISFSLVPADSQPRTTLSAPVAAPKKAKESGAKAPEQTDSDSSGSGRKEQLPSLPADTARGQEEAEPLKPLANGGDTKTEDADAGAAAPAATSPLLNQVEKADGAALPMTDPEAVLPTQTRSWPVSAPLHPAAQRESSNLACRSFPEDALPVHFITSASSNMVPLHSSLYSDSYPGMLLASKDLVFAAAATDPGPQPRFRGRFPAGQLEQHGTRPHAVLWRLNTNLLELARSSQEQPSSDEACALLPYYTCSPINARKPCSEGGKGKAECVCSWSSPLLADFRDGIDGADAGAASALPVLHEARQQLRWLSRDPFDGSAEPGSPPPGEPSNPALPRILDCFSKWLSIAPADWSGSSAWPASISKQLRASVLVTRVDDAGCHPSASGTDRNWLSGVIATHRFAQPQADGSASVSCAALESHPPLLDSGMEAPIDIVLLQHGKPRGDSFGHVDPLLPATVLFRACAGVSHPAFTGRPSAWLPFSTVLEEVRFATPYYDGLIDFDWNEARWQREQGSSLQPDKWPGHHAVIRAGSVIRYRSTSSAGSALRQGVVLLTYVHVSASSTDVWKAPALRQHSDHAHTAQAIEEFCSAFPATPMAALCVWQLKTDSLAEGSTEWASQPKSVNGLDADVTVDRVVSVAVPDAANRLWAAAGPPRTVTHHVFAKTQARRAGTDTALSLPLRTVDSIVLEQSDSDAGESALMVWFRQCKEHSEKASESRPEKLQSFYADLVRTAQGDFNARAGDQLDRAGPVELLMQVRRALNVPQPQTEAAAIRTPRSHPVSAIFNVQAPPSAAAAAADASPAAALPAAALPARSQAVRREANSSSAAAAAAAPVAKRAASGRTKRSLSAIASAVNAPSAETTSAAAPAAKKSKTGRSAAKGPAAAAKADRDVKVLASASSQVAALFQQLSRLDVSEHSAPFAALLWHSLPAEYSKAKSKKRAGMEATARTEALATLQQFDPPVYHALEFAAEKHALAAGRSQSLEDAITAIHHVNSCENGRVPDSDLTRLPGTPTRAWMDHRGLQPMAAAPTVAQRMAAEASSPQPPLRAGVQGPGSAPDARSRQLHPASSSAGPMPRHPPPPEPSHSESQLTSVMLMIQQQAAAQAAAQAKAAAEQTKAFQAQMTQLVDLVGKVTRPAGAEVAATAPAGHPVAATTRKAPVPSSGRGGKRGRSAQPDPDHEEAAAASTAPASAQLARDQRRNKRSEKSTAADGSEDASSSEEEPSGRNKRARGSSAGQSQRAKGQRGKPAKAAPVPEEDIEFTTPAAAAAGASRALLPAPAPPQPNIAALVGTLKAELIDGLQAGFNAMQQQQLQNSDRRRLSPERDEYDRPPRRRQLAAQYEDDRLPPFSEAHYRPQPHRRDHGLLQPYIPPSQLYLQGGNWMPDAHLPPQHHAFSGHGAGCRCAQCCQSASRHDQGYYYH